MLTRSMESFEQVRPAPLRGDFREPDQDAKRTLSRPPASDVSSALPCVLSESSRSGVRRRFWRQHSRTEAAGPRAQSPSWETQALTANCTIVRRLPVASRAIIGKVDRQGDSQAIYLGHSCYPDRRAQCCWNTIPTRNPSICSSARET